VDFFFYGTLMDADVLTAVIGRRLAPAHMDVAVVQGYRRVYVADAWYPMLVPDAGGEVRGYLVSTIDGREADRISRYEGVEYDRQAVLVIGTGRGPVQAQIYMARPGVKASDRDWDLDAWRRRYRTVYRDLTKEMSDEGGDGEEKGRGVPLAL
jgi:gamma-glutamylcyclotransferase (GGCT)/AIG2-like uncharacterized protein YtfP